MSGGEETPSATLLYSVNNFAKVQNGVRSVGGADSIFFWVRTRRTVGDDRASAPYAAFDGLVLDEYLRWTGVRTMSVFKEGARDVRPGIASTPPRFLSMIRC